LGIEGINNSNVIYFPDTGTFYYEFLTDNQGDNIHIQDLTRPRKSYSNSAIWSSNTDAEFARFSYANVSNNFTTSVSNTLLLDSITTLNLGNVYLPTAQDGRVVNVRSNNAVQTLHLISNTATIIGNVATLAANSGVAYQYVSAANKWFRTN
jgi:hypothetical protein